MANNVYTDLFEFCTLGTQPAEIKAAQFCSKPIVTAAGEIILNSFPKGTILYLCCSNEHYSVAFQRPRRRQKIPEVSLDFIIPEPGMNIDFTEEPKDLDRQVTGGSHQLTVVYDTARFILDSNSEILACSE